MSPQAKCPLCGKPTTHDSRPFCSKSCKDRDLVGWLNESYRVPARPETDDEADSLFDGEEG